MEDKTDLSSGRTRYDLCLEANRILAEAGLGIWGGKNDSKGFQQRRFESRMQRGAYSRSSESRRKG
jgi:hypothetical protein